MADLNDEDTALLLSFEHCEHLSWLGVTAMRAEPFGVALEKRRKIVGVWSYYRGQYRYRSLASWEPIATVATLDMALELTSWMADFDAWIGVPNVKGKPH